MRSTISSPFAAVFRTEVLFNLKRVAPYALMIIFSLWAILWWGWGPAVVRGWAVNSDFYIMRLFLGFSFVTGLPLFIALMMGDPVIRDFRIGVDPLIFSKPVGRAEYLLGKFFGNFLVLVCCQACFAFTALLLQAFSREGMIVLPPRVLPYFQHFFFFVVITSLALGAVCFTVGTLTRSIKTVYGLAISFYFLYVAWQLTIKRLPMGWRSFLDPLLFNVAAESFKGRSADWLNQAAISYDGYMIANRVLMIAVSLLCLAILYFRFSPTEQAGTNAELNRASLFDLTPRAERLYGGTEDIGSIQTDRIDEAAAGGRVALPQVGIVTRGVRAHLGQYSAALRVEFRLLRAERSLVAVAPLVVFLCGLEVAAHELAPEASYSATYASRTANALLLFLFGVAVFYTGETMHRDRELNVEPVLWSTPASDFVLLLSKSSAALFLSASLIAAVGLAAIGIQAYRGHSPLEQQAYLATYAVILMPSVVFMIAASVALNILLRDKYLAYAASLAVGGAFYYFAGRGYNNWLYNPVLYQLWTPSDLAGGGGRLALILIHRIYCLAFSILLFAVALLFTERKSARGFLIRGRLSGKGWAVLTAVASGLIAVITGAMIVGRI